MTLNSILRSIGSVVLSLIIAFALVVGIEGVSAELHPFPEDFGGTREEIVAHVANYPTLLLAFLGIAGWGGTMFISTWLATRLGSGRHPAHGFGVGLFLLAMVVLNMSMLPYPLWFWVLNLVVLPFGMYFGTTLGRDRQLVSE